MTIRNSPSPANIRGHFAGVMRLSTNKVGRSSLILASLVLAGAITLPRAAFAAPAGTTVGPSPTLTRTGGKDPTINFTLNMGGNIGSGTLTATNLGGGLYQATSGKLTMTGGLDANNTYCLVPTGAPPGQVLTSPLGLFLYDDLLQPAVNPAFPDIYGLLFSNTAAACGTGFTGNDEINIWAGPQSGFTGTPGQYSFYDGRGGGGYLIAYTTPAPATAPDSFTGTVVSTTYAYSGNAFNRFECTNSPPDCATPGPGNPYGTKNSVTAALQTAAPLAASTTENVLCDPNFLSLTLNDGVNTITVNTPCGAEATSVAGAAAWVTTDNNGNITAWYLDAYLPTTGSPTEDIHTLYDPLAGIAGASGCNGCYGSDDPKGEDKGSTTTTQGGPTIYYGYVLESPGSLIPPGQGGVTTAGNCTAASPCQSSPVSTTVVTVPPDVPFPTFLPMAVSAYFIRSDPRGDNCGYNGLTGRPTTLDVSTLTLYTSSSSTAQPISGSFLGHEVIPSNICIPKGGAWLEYGIDETLAGINGVNVYPSFVPPQPWASGILPDGTTNLVACPTAPFTANSGYTGGLIASAPRAASVVETQEPQQLGFNGVGPPVFVPSTKFCDLGGSTGRPARSIYLYNVVLMHAVPGRHLPGAATNQQILVYEIGSELFYLQAGLLPLINFQPASVRSTLQACYIRADSLILQGKYNCAAYQTYQCDQILTHTPVAEVGPSNSVLRLSDPWGLLHSDNLGLGFLLNAAAGNDTSVSIDDPNVLSKLAWPPPPASCPAH
ncbi:MAG: hypothetical protein JO184_20675 [Gammaproteobacteria bacterium]|nr:hypothetical protein [Gammaproteobacteria bacterium]